MQSKSKVNIYDFKTIYVGNFYVDFFFFALMQKKSLIFLLPKIIFYFILYCLKIISFAKFQKNYEMILKYFSDPVNLVNNFWQKYESKINPVLKVIMEHDSQAIIITNFSEMIITPLKKNCKVKKIISYQDFNNNYQKYSIHNSYLSTYSHKLIAQNSQNAYMLNHDKIITYDSQKLYMKQIGKTGTIIGIIFAIFYFLLGMMINYNYNMTRNLDFLFDSDTYRVYQDFTLINEDHYRIDVHPLFLFCQPLIFLFNGITQNNVISVLLFQAFIGFLSIKYLYQTLNILNKEKWPNLLLCIIYGFSFSTFAPEAPQP